MPNTTSNPAWTGALVVAFFAAAVAALLTPTLTPPTGTQEPAPAGPLATGTTSAPGAREQASNSIPAPRFGALRVHAVGEGRATEVGGLGFAKSTWVEPRRLWPPGARLVVERTPGERAIDEPTVAIGAQERTGVVAFERLAPGRYVVGLLARDAAWEPRIVLVSADAWTEVELPCTTPPAMGTLVVDAQHSGGARPDTFAVVIEDVATGVELLAREAFAWEANWPQRFDLPAGRYRVIVEGAAELDDYHGTLTQARSSGRVEQEVAVEPARETRLTASVPGGARMQLTVHAEIGERECAAFLARFGDQGAYNLEYFSHLATLELRRPGRAPLPVVIRWEMEGSSAAGTHLRSALPVETTQVSELLPAGRFVLVARLTSGREVERAVELVEGETLAVELAIE
ncbi:MAG: hypothetical protein HZA53_09195 [Planctomycetes bacterium]|nr:hypothetical protein [Planctomycetota bacterium]